MLKSVSVHPLHGDVEVVRQPWLQGAIELHVPHLILQSLPEVVAQALQPDPAFLLIAKRQFCSPGETHNQRHRQGAGAQALFLPSSEQQRLQRQPFTHQRLTIVLPTRDTRVPTTTPGPTVSLLVAVATLPTI